MAEILEPALDKARATAALTPPARQLHRWVLTVFIDTGHAPPRADLERMARDHGVDPAAALSELTTRDVLAVDEQGEIRAAYPFSPTPTRHRVTWDGGTGVHAMCAIDALGISAMLSVPVTVTSTEPDTNHEVTVQVDHNTARWHPTTAVVFAGTTAGACCPSVDRTCGHINFYTTADAAHDWATRHPEVTGVVLDQAQALTCGIAEFGALIRPLDQPAGEDIGR
ncbi:alkylmercury lyase family protein [Actinophytocola sp. NPDC049390]|uniref:alkylmercury lyase family protein n=1 Tax=Actinophytocola sp. NPDC049390 TaxID=3363894 RepID=UPI0037B77E90